MILHFNLKRLFGLCWLLICWQTLLPFPLVGAAFCIGGMAVLLRKDFSVADTIFSAAFLMNVWYITTSMGNVRQYDYYNFVMFADYFIRHDFFVFQPLMFFQDIYFQPPLWGLITALVTKFCMVLGVSQETGFDCIRYISLFCVSGCGIVFWRLMEMFKLKLHVQLSLFALFCFFPANIILANLVNNDAAVYFLMLAMTYAGCRWYLSGSWKDTIVVAGLLFVAGMTKFSGLMLVPAFGMLGLCRLFQANDKFSSRLWGQFFLIGSGVISGFSWGWLLLYHHLPLVSPPINVDFQDMGAFSLTQRLFSLDTSGHPFADVWKGQSEANVFLALLKTALFGEWSWELNIWAYVLYGAGFILVMLLIISFFSLWRYRLGEEYAFNLFFVTAVFSVFIAWMHFWLSYPYFCSCEFRYVAILLPLSLLWLGNYLSQKSLPKVVNYTLAGGVWVFIFAEFMLYLHTI